MDAGPRQKIETGSPTQVASALSSFRVYASRQGLEGAAEYLMAHSAIMYLMGPAGEPISFFARDATPGEIAADLAKYVR